MKVTAARVLVALGGCNTHGDRFRGSRVKLTDIDETKFANEAFPQWPMANPSKPCRAILQEFTKYMTDDSPEAAKDAWGRPLKMHCALVPPPGATGFAVSSNGNKGADNNGYPDDIVSWK